MEPAKYEIVNQSGMWQIWKNDFFICSCARKSNAQYVIRALKSYMGK